MLPSLLGRVVGHFVGQCFRQLRAGDIDLHPHGLAVRAHHVSVDPLAVFGCECLLEFQALPDRADIERLAIFALPLDRRAVGRRDDGSADIGGDRDFGFVVGDRDLQVGLVRAL